jgi:alpha-beta hydrolase superfamily lysophospholipase
MKFLKLSIIFWATLYLLGLALIYFFQDRLVFSPVKLNSDYKFNFTAPFEETYLESDTGHKVHYLKFKTNKPSAVILYFHGNGGALNSWGFFAEKLSLETNTDVWIMDYPGYGKSSKDFARSSAELIEIGEELLERVRLEHQNLPVILYGRSLGTGLASSLSTDASVDGLILETPYFTTTRLAKEMFPVVPSFIFKYDLDNSKLKKNKLRKVLIIHGDSDRVISQQHSLDLKKEFSERVDLLIFPSGGHNNLSTFDGYWPALKKYIANR